MSKLAHLFMIVTACVGSAYSQSFVTLGGRIEVTGGDSYKNPRLAPFGLACGDYQSANACGLFEYAPHDQKTYLDSGSTYHGRGLFGWRISRRLEPLVAVDWWHQSNALWSKNTTSPGVGLAARLDKRFQGYVIYLLPDVTSPVNRSSGIVIGVNFMDTAKMTGRGIYLGLEHELGWFQQPPTGTQVCFKLSAKVGYSFSRRSPE